MPPMAEPLTGKAALLLTAAGSSSRFCSVPEEATSEEAGFSQGKIKKEYLLLQGRPVLLRALAPFLSIADMGAVVITVPPGDEEAVWKMVSAAEERANRGSRCSFSILAGGKTRQESVLLGLEEIARTAPQTVLAFIHDGARPWISIDLIRAVMAEARQSGAAIPVEPSTSAMKEIDRDGTILRHLPRASTVAAQTPQTFAFPAILEAHRQLRGDGRLYIDDAELFSAWGRKVTTVPGDPENRKITYRSDMP